MKRAMFNVGHPAYPSNSANAYLPKVGQLKAYQTLRARGCSTLCTKNAIAAAKLGHFTTVWNQRGEVIEINLVPPKYC